MLSGRVRRRPGLFALFTFLTITRPSLAQEAAAPPPDSYPPPGYYPPPEYYPPPDAYPPSVYYPPAGGAQLGAEAVSATPAAPASEPAPRFLFGGTLAAASRSETNSTSVILSPLLEAAFAVHRSVLIDLAWGFAWAVDGEGLGESTARTGNPMLSGLYRTERGPWHIRAGLAVTAPLATLPLSLDGRLYAFVYNQTMSMWGMWNQWLWSPGRMAVPVSGSADYLLPGNHRLSVEAALAPLIGVRNGASGTDWLGQAALDASFAVTTSFALCPRLQMVLLPSAGIDRLQMAAGLRGTLKTKAGRYFAGLLVNLDEPLGGGAGLGRWGFHLGKEIGL